VTPENNSGSRPFQQSHCSLAFAPGPKLNPLSFGLILSSRNDNIVMSEAADEVSAEMFIEHSEQSWPTVEVAPSQGYSLDRKHSEPVCFLLT
jgi:hypothetical protein